MLYVLPLRIPVPCDFEIHLSEWLDDEETIEQNLAAAANNNNNNNNEDDDKRGPHYPRHRPSFSSKNCGSDLEYLAYLRYQIGRTLQKRGFGAVNTKSNCLNGIMDSTSLSDHYHAMRPSNYNSKNSSSSNNNNNNELEQQLQEYAAALKDCEERGFPITDAEDPLQKLPLSWRYRSPTDNMELEEEPTQDIIETHYNLRWERANVIWNLATIEAYKAAEAVTTDDPNAPLTRSAWARCGQHLQNAAHLIRHLRTKVVPQQQQVQQRSTRSIHGSSRSLQSNRSSSDPQQGAGESFYLIFSTFFLELWERFCTAEAQRAAYEAFCTVARPKSFLLAKLAAGAAPLYQYVEDLCQSPETERLLESFAAAIAASNNNSNNNNNNNNKNDSPNPQKQQQQKPPQSSFKLKLVLMDWEDTVRAWGMWMTCVTEYHQSVLHREQSEYGLELARLEAALQFGGFCREFCDSGADSDLLDSLAMQVMPMLEQMEERFELALKENQTKHRQEIPDIDELPEVQPQLSVTTPESIGEEMVESESYGKGASGGNQDISRLLPSSNRPMFAMVIADHSQRKYAEIFRQEINALIDKQANVAEDETERGRQALASIRLPQSLTVYKQELENIAKQQEQENDAKNPGSASASSAGNIPEPLWERIEQFQNDRGDERVKDDLNYIRQCAELANNLYLQMQDSLDDDLEVDRMFREHNPSFQGYNVMEIQKAFRSALENYNRLLTSAGDSDQLLKRRCEVLDSDPKFRLLGLSKSQLSRLVMPASAKPPQQQQQNDNKNKMDVDNEGEIDVSLLSKYLVDLSLLFNDRESLVHSMRERAKTYNIVRDFQTVANESASGRDQAELEDEYMRIIDEVKDSFHDMIEGLHGSMERQIELLDVIAKENEKFIEAWDRQKSEREQKRNNRSPKNGSNKEENSFVTKIEDALGDIQQFSQHLKEGRNFYDVVIPKLQKLKQQVVDVGTRLANERAEFETRNRRAMAGGGGYPSVSPPGPGGYPGRMAPRDMGPGGMGSRDMGPRDMGPRDVGPRDVGPRDMGPGGYPARGGPYGGGPRPMPPGMGGGGGRDDYYERGRDPGYYGRGGYPDQGPGYGYSNQPPYPPPGRQDQRFSRPNPGVESISHRMPDVRVDDEKVASLVAMDFDAGKVVAALKKYNNNFEQALNDLLSG